MMNWFISETDDSFSVNKTAGSKARLDIERILSENGFSPLMIACQEDKRKGAGLLTRLSYHFKVFLTWQHTFAETNRGDRIVVQFPVLSHSVFLARAIEKVQRRGVKIMIIVHDLECLRGSKDHSAGWLKRKRVWLEETKILQQADSVIVHNGAMKNYLHGVFDIALEKMVPIEVFDYLLPEDFVPDTSSNQFKSCIIAGNLMRNKAGYAYALPGRPDFELYGVDFEGETQNNVHYHGAFDANELPSHLKGGFGLVWDGSSTATCEGVYGEYLKFNNPHKTSLYLACGIPVIIWEQAALCEYILSNKVGIAVESVEQIGQRLEEMSLDEYKELKERAVRISGSFRRGEHLKEAMRRTGAVDLV